MQGESSKKPHVMKRGLGVASMGSKKPADGLALRHRMAVHESLAFIHLRKEHMDGFLPIVAIDL